MTLEAVQAVTPSSGVLSTPWAGGQLPSPWSLPNGTAGPPAIQKPLPSSLPNAFTQALEQARATVGSSTLPITAHPPVNPATASPTESGVAKRLGMSSIETMGTRLSQADAKMFQSVENLNNLNPMSPNMQAELLSVSLMSAKSGISTTLAMKFSSKINESINTLLKTS